MVRLARFELATNSLWWRRQDSNLHSRFLPIELLPQRPLHYQLMLQSHIACLKFKTHKHLEPKGQATMAVISHKLVGVQGIEPWASRSQI